MSHLYDIYSELASASHSTLRSIIHNLLADREISARVEDIASKTLEKSQQSIDIPEFPTKKKPLRGLTKAPTLPILPSREKGPNTWYA